MISLKSVLEVPSVYQWFQEALGGREAHRHFVNQHLQPRPNDRVLDIGCGPAQILQVMPRHVQYVGVDMNSRYIDSAKSRYGTRGTFVCQSVSEMLVENGHAFDLVMAHGLIHHLNDYEADQLFQIASLALKPGGRFVTVDGCFVDGQSRIARWMLRNDRGHYVRTEPAYQEIAGRTFSSVRSTIRHDLLRTPYTHIIMESQNPHSPEIGDMV